MKKLLLLYFATVPFQLLFAQTILGMGDLVLFHYKSDPANNSANSLGFMSRTYIESGSQFTITNRDWSNINNGFSTSNATDQADITITLDEPISVGQTFFIYVSTQGTSSSIGTVSVSSSSGFTGFEFSNANGCEKLYVYSGNTVGSTTNNSLNWICAALWNGVNSISGDYPEVSGSNVFNTTSADASQNGIDFSINGNSTKCGVWTPTTNWNNGTSPQILAGLSIDDPLYPTYYDKSRWAFSSSNGVVHCDPTASTGQFSATSFLESTLSFSEYRYGYIANEWEEKISNGTWQYINGVQGTLPDWSTITRTKKVTFYQSYTLGSFDPTSSSNQSEVFEAAELYLVDSLNHVELTITPGDILSVQRVIDYRDAIGTDALVPIIKMSSDYDASQTLHYSQLAITAAVSPSLFFGQF